jgi:hypothetical protein
LVVQLHLLVLDTFATINITSLSKM